MGAAVIPGLFPTESTGNRDKPAVQAEVALATTRGATISAMRARKPSLTLVPVLTLPMGS